MRYLVLDMGGDSGATDVAASRSVIIAEFDDELGAIGLVLNRLAQGDRGIAAVDSVTGQVVFPPTETDCEDEGPAESGTRRRVFAEGAEGQPERVAFRRRGRR